MDPATLKRSLSAPVLHSHRLPLSSPVSSDTSSPDMSAITPAEISESSSPDGILFIELGNQIQKLDKIYRKHRVKPDESTCQQIMTDLQKFSKNFSLLDKFFLDVKEFFGSFGYKKGEEHCELLLGTIPVKRLPVLGTEEKK